MFDIPVPGPVPYFEPTTALIRLALVGDIEFEDAEGLDALVGATVDLVEEYGGDPGRAAAVVADLSGVGFLDSTGINQLLRLHRRAEVLPGGLHLVVTPDQRLVRSLFETVGLLRVFAGVHATAAEAVLAASPGLRRAGDGLGAPDPE
ncbi:STAS domain-containing protein [Actinokineospora bangkokensis]|uniref:STAS domain-containing protein n=1 Tax=Actinokineospora bangkokensis TaxID=1193682 RepID=A0A1Q9LK35_9PSEU|nr:STAS domain-containing protein [Actinokineospora bangkokensis]OLR92349.1 hypothetical protein BJP25_19845 [Actinokineospora bangkokensis]